MTHEGKPVRQKSFSDLAFDGKKNHSQRTFSARNGCGTAVERIAQADGAALSEKWPRGWTLCYEFILCSSGTTSLRFPQKERIDYYRHIFVRILLASCNLRKHACVVGYKKLQCIQIDFALLVLLFCNLRDRSIRF